MMRPFFFLSFAWNRTSPFLILLFQHAHGHGFHFSLFSFHHHFFIAHIL
jgi:hypothetical protein